MDATSASLPLAARPFDALRGTLRFILLLSIIGFAWLRFHLGGARTMDAQADWLGRLARRVAKLIGVRIEVVGVAPASGLVVANHLSYVDIIVLGALLRPIFVSKAEVARWPVFGRTATYGGTIYIDREKRGAVAPVAAQMAAVLAAGRPLVLFPEGTSSGGETVLPFKPSLFAVVRELDHPVAACGIDYRLPGGSVPDEVCYWGDDHFGPHLLNLLSRRDLTVRLAFGPSRRRHGDRKEIARELHAEVTALRGGSTEDTE